MSSSIPTPTPTPFDPFLQTFTLLLPDGVTPFTVDIPSLDEYATYNSLVCVNYAAQIGASIIMLLVVLLTTRAKKRRSPIFALNVVSLLLSALRSLLQTLYWVGPFTESYAYFSGNYSRIPRSAYANSIAAIVLTLLFLCTVEASLVLQTNVVCTTLAPASRFLIIALSSAISLLTVGLRFAVTVQNTRAILDLQQTYSIQWLASAALIMETISIWFFCIVFVSKLAVTIWARKMMGLKQWGPMEIICIMGGCTLIIPSIFAILEYFPNSTFPEAGSLALTLVAIFLPLSSVWAAASIEGSSPVFNDTTRKMSAYNGSTFQTTNSGSGIRKGSAGMFAGPKGHVADVAADKGGFAEKGVNGDGVMVDRTFVVLSD